MNLVLKIILTSDFLLLIVIVTGGEELSKDESGHIDLLHLVLHHRNTLPIIPHTDGVVFTKGGNTHTHIFIMCYCGCGYLTNYMQGDTAAA